MPTYEFVVQGDNVAAQPKVRVTTLPDDDTAWDYAEAVIRKLQLDEPRAEDHRVMVISSSERIIGSIAFNLAALRQPKAGGLN